MSMQSPWDDLTSFNWVLACGSTLAASAVLGIPQSTLSRRFRAFCSAHRLRVGRRGAGLRLLSDQSYVADLRSLAQAFRCRHGLCCYALPAQAIPDAHHPLNLPGHPLLLTDALFERIDQFLDEGSLDIAVLPGSTVKTTGSIPMISAADRLAGLERDGLLAFHRRLELELQPLLLPPQH